ncbi:MULTISPECIES: M23 family metallopeptidase [unclassified Paenibacillus]|uniref:M23 family metallopeptidase n=1 Tax=unclassified Paenibacillus TaxID=185978 RepID=UPI001AEB7D27|nr:MULTISPECIES: M23 family metallopeptidase [unclassified Paenibacillus]MBP1157833.1 stage II sporulation protein Q [Paenibacillus sp. PvP091]MBP1171431.1 stage II sporulation protein Q [Paenibacillus sp. PvR098]MBP2442459.1 stage II sporulation protein Q [Paenibacillus sp. PvP052]
MSEQKRDLPKQEEAPKSIEGAKNSSTSSWKRLLAKKWVFPAMYMAAAAIILTVMWVYQGAGTMTSDKVSVDASQTGTVTDSVTGEDAVATNANQETMQWPFKDKNELDVVLPFFDNKATNEVRQAAMVEYGDTFTPHIGMDFARPDNQTFDVMAVMSGKVTALQKDPIVGHLVEITHSTGLVSVYQSLAEVNVAKDAEVKKGDVIAKAGRNELEKEQGVHLHFELRQGQGGPAVNPESYIPEQ